jgi:hypothetical protein
VKRHSGFVFIFGGGTLLLLVGFSFREMIVRLRRAQRERRAGRPYIGASLAALFLWGWWFWMVLGFAVYIVYVVETECVPGSPCS